MSNTLYYNSFIDRLRINKCIRRSSKPKLHLKNDFQYGGCNVARSWHWFRQATAPCNVACGSGIMTVNSPNGSTLQCGHIGIPVSIMTISPQSTCHSAPVFEILSKSDHPQQKKRHVDFRGPVMGSLKSPCTNRRTGGHARRMKPLSLSRAAA